MQQTVEKKAERIREVHPVDVEDLAREWNACMECGGKLARDPETRELVCTDCGRVWGREVLEERIPFGEDTDDGHSESHWNPGSDLSDAHGLGTCQGSKPPGKPASRQSFAILGKTVDKPVRIKCPHCKNVFEWNNLPLRAQQTTMIVEKYEHPKIGTLLRFGRQRAKEWGYDVASDRSHVFKNQYGEIVRIVGERIVDRGLRANLQGFPTPAFS